MKDKILLSFVIVVAFIAGIVFLTKGGNAPKTPDIMETSSWKSFTDETSGISYLYPNELDATYIRGLDWPPMVQLVPGPFVCNEAGDEFKTSGLTKKEVINGNTYCITKYTEGAAGSIFSLYAYGYQTGDKIAYFTFSTQAVQCDNFSEPEKIACNKERENFNIQLVADKIIQSANLPK